MSQIIISFHSKQLLPTILSSTKPSATLVLMEVYTSVVFAARAVMKLRNEPKLSLRFARLL
jgi:hypothetical protein